MGAAVVPLPVRRVRACDRFESDGGPICKCGWAMILHRVWCSSCGGSFYVKRRANALGFSMCNEHRGRK